MAAFQTNDLFLSDGPDIRARYELHRDRCAESLSRYARWDLWVANLRLVIFVAAAVGAWTAWKGGPWWLLGVAVVAYAGLALGHGLLLRGKQTGINLLAVYEEGLARLNGTWRTEGSDGSDLTPAHHPCAEDIDLTGPDSLFPRINTCRTRLGEEKLAQWLLEGGDAAAAQARMSAARELAQNHALRLLLAASGRPDRVTTPTHDFAAWAEAPDRFGGKGWMLWCIVNAAVLAACIALSAAGRFAAPVLLLFTVNLVHLSLAKARIAAQQEWAEASCRHWQVLGGLILLITDARFESAYLQGLSARLWQPTRASDAFRQLDRLILALQMPLNQFFMPIAVLTLWPVVFGMAVERWRRRFGPHFPEWLDALGEVEALCALATFALEHPEHVYPEWSETPVFEAEGLAHPLLPAATRVANDVRLGPGQRLIVLSGSNMSGKSTLLRSIGINAALAMAGAPVCAKAMRLSPVSIGATMRVHDSIQEGASRFYAEVLRLRQLLDLARGPRPLLYLCDEILHGTNSHDRLEGARALLKAFQDADGIGVMTTHDLALTALAGELGEAVNLHLQDQFDGEKLVFDYRLRPGVVQKSNALALMRSAGLPL